jgi:hypothetical protein
MSFNGNGYPESEGFDITNKGSIHTSSGSGNTAQAVSGNNGYVLSENSSQSNGLEWIANPSEIGFDNSVKGDIHSFSTTQAKIGVSGNNGYVLTEDSTTATGLAWSAVSGGANTALSNLSSAQLNEGIDINNKALDETGFLLFKMGGGTAISSGTLTIQQSFALVDTEGSASSDDLDDITQPASQIGEALLVLKCTHFGRNVVVKDGTGNLYLAGDFSLENVVDTLTLIGVSSGAGYYEISRSDNN